MSQPGSRSPTDSQAHLFHDEQLNQPCLWKSTITPKLNGKFKVKKSQSYSLSISSCAFLRETRAGNDYLKGWQFGWLARNGQVLSEDLMCWAKGYGERSLRPKHNTAQMKACCLTPLAFRSLPIYKKGKKKKKKGIQTSWISVWFAITSMKINKIDVAV